jgi:hypothetical protein
MLQLPQSLAWLHDAPEPLVVVIERWIVVVPAKPSLPGISASVIANNAATIERVARREIWRETFGTTPGISLTLSDLVLVIAVFMATRQASFSQ